MSKYTAGMVGGMLFIFNSITSYLACACAGFCNVFFMRSFELLNGITIYDPSDSKKKIATSKFAARKAVL